MRDFFNAHPILGYCIIAGVLILGGLAWIALKIFARGMSDVPLDDD